MNRILLCASAALMLAGCTTTRKTTARPVEEVTTPQQFSDSQMKHYEKALDGKWLIYSVRGKSIGGTEEEDEWPSLQFTSTDSRIYGYDGCNYINGEFSVMSGQRLTFGDMLSTMKSCPESKPAMSISSALADTRSYSIVTTTTDITLNLHNANGLTVMTLRRSPIDFLNGAWLVTGINGDDVDNPDVRLVIDIPEKRIHGNTGCNILNGSLALDPQTPMSIQFMSLATTRMACPDNGVERDLLIALEEVTTTCAGKHGTARLLDKKGKTLITLSPISRQDL